VKPAGSTGEYGVTAIETSPGAPTVSSVDEVTEPEAAVIVAVPTPELVASPAALMIAAAAEDELHCTVEVRFCVVPSV